MVSLLGPGCSAAARLSIQQRREQVLVGCGRLTAGPAVGGWRRVGQLPEGSQPDSRKSRRPGAQGWQSISLRLRASVFLVVPWQHGTPGSHHH